MKNIEPYLIFNGNCEEAFNFYKSVFETEIPFMLRYKDMPKDMPDNHNIPEADMNRILHIILPVSKEVSIMGSDSPSSMENIKGNNISLTLNVENETEAKRVFEKLSEGGEISMPLQKTFWADLYAMFTDQFGINWMINYMAEKK